MTTEHPLILTPEDTLRDYKNYANLNHDFNVPNVYSKKNSN